LASTTRIKLELGSKLSPERSRVPTLLGSSVRRSEMKESQNVAVIVNPRMQSALHKLFSNTVLSISRAAPFKMKFMKHRLCVDAPGMLLPEGADLLFQLVNLAAFGLERIGKAAVVAAGVAGGSGSGRGLSRGRRITVLPSFAMDQWCSPAPFHLQHPRVGMGWCKWMQISLSKVPQRRSRSAAAAEGSAISCSSRDWRR